MNIAYSSLSHGGMGSTSVKSVNKSHVILQLHKLMLLMMEMLQMLLYCLTQGLTIPTFLVH